MGVWTHRQQTYPKLVPVVLDIITVPASQAVAEQTILELWVVQAGCINRLEKSLEMRAFFKINGRQFASVIVTSSPALILR
jgi:hypothetical protein